MNSNDRCIEAISDLIKIMYVSARIYSSFIVVEKAIVISCV